MTENQAREYVRKLSRFYTDALIYVVVNLGLILIWAISGGGYFWPIWVIIGWGIGLGVHAFSLGLIPQINNFVPFMTPEWEEKEVDRIMGKKTSAGKKTTSGIAEKISSEITALQKEVTQVVAKAKQTKAPKPKKKTNASKAVRKPTKKTKKSKA
jgi:hypothetical protein